MNFPRLLWSLTVLLLLYAPLRADTKNADFFIRNGDRVVFYGDSITDGQLYPTLIKTFILTRYPTWRNDFFNRGQSGDNAGNLARFQRDVIDLKPDAVTFMMGYNDGGYQRFNTATQDRFIANVEKSVTMLHAVRPATRVMLVSSPPNELTVSADNRWVSHEWYPYHLLMLSQSEEILARRLGVGFIDMTRLYGQTMGLGTVMAGNGFALSRDGVHPQDEGQTFIAYHVLRGMNAAAKLATLTIDLAGKKAKFTAARCKVSNLKLEGGTLTFQRLCESLPYPTPEVVRPFAFLVQLDDTLNDDRLTVTGLTAPAYRLSIDGRTIADLSATELAAGVNLSRFSNTPMYEQAMQVFEAVRTDDNYEHGYWKSYIQFGPTDPNTIPLPAVRQLSLSREYSYTFNTPKSHTFKLEPLDKPVPVLDEASGLGNAFLGASMAAVPIDWNNRAVTDAPLKIHLENPAGAARPGTITW